ncbi:MAG TPA: hypothetical protein O0X39_02915 [Methanocorpusculum sp.]|nr:hypothetical protein [Methanocorpusculum sp.]
MILHDAVKKLEEYTSGMGCEDGNLQYTAKEHGNVCTFCTGKCMEVQFGGRVAEISTPVPFTACMKLENLFPAPLKSDKTRGAAAGALTAAAGFLMLTRKTSACDSLLADDCREELISFCSGRAVYVIGKDIAGLNQAARISDAELVIVTGDALTDEALLERLGEAECAGKEMLYLGPECAGAASLLQKKMWCPYGN